MKDFILEIYSEEIPARMQKMAELNFYKICETFFNEQQIAYENLRVDAGPCRIVIRSKVTDIIPAKIVEIKGPKIDANEQAILGFCKANQIEKKELITQKIKDQDFYFYINRVTEQRVKEIIENNLPSFLHKIVWPKSMAWEETNLPWVRPIRSILCLLATEIVKIKFINLVASNYTYGHKFMSQHKKIEIADSRDYEKKIEEHKVILSRLDRETKIRESLLEICAKLKITFNRDEKLIEEVAGLAEYPVILYGKIDQKFMDLPAEVLITSMRYHQKYFTANDENEKLAAYFLFVTNLDLEDYSEIIAGNERVLSARLADALYFYNNDQSNGLESNNEKLKEIIFHAKIGNMHDKIIRIEKLCEFIAPNNKAASEAAKISKSDLVSEMVGEFPELQGIMGSYYAAKHGYNAEICDAIKNHYKPIGAEDETPKESAAILAISDKIDSLSTLFYAGERATGSKDPYALRRYALGIIRTILDNKLQIDLKQIIYFAFSLLEKSDKTQDLTNEILLFIEERFKQFLKQDFPHDVINACIDLSLSSNLLLSYSKIIALDNALKQNNKKLVALYKRIKNIIGTGTSTSKVNELLLQTSSEKSLYKQILETEQKLDLFIENKNYEKALMSLEELEKAFSLFFEENLVNSEDVKITANRTSILIESHSLFSKFANFDALE